MDVDEVAHFATGEPIARVSRANGGLIQRDMRKAARARDCLRAMPIDELIERIGAASGHYMQSTLPSVPLTHVSRMPPAQPTPSKMISSGSAKSRLVHEAPPSYAHSPSRQDRP